MADEYPDPLEGDLTVGALAELISRTMPEDEPQACQGEAAEQVAAYIHEAFYSEAARIRNRPPRVTLARLTAEQLRQSLADLYARFHSPNGANPFPEAAQSSDGPRGLQGEYYTGARPRTDKRRIERVDPQIDFDFGEKGPGQGIDAQDYSIRWTGALLADTSGPHEIVVRCSSAFVLSLGDYDRQFINNRVQSGDQREFRRTIVLTAGRAYPVQLELYQRKRKTKQPPVVVSLSWTPPGRVERLVPRANLLPERVPAAFSLQAVLPADDRSYGYERGVAIDRQWDESTTAAALEFGEAAALELWPAYRRRNRDGDEQKVLRQFLVECAETAMRGPLDEPQRKRFIDDSIAATASAELAIKRCMLLTLKSPRFLYPRLDADRSASRQAANRLALILFDSLPVDAWLLQQVERDGLADEAQVRAAAERMAADPRARAKLRMFLRHWLDLEDESDEEIAKDAERFPEFDREVVEDLRQSFDGLLERALDGQGDDLRELLLSAHGPTTQRLAEIYGDAWAAAWQQGDEPLPPLESDAARPGGLLTHPYLLSRLAYRDSTSPIHRGVFLLRHVLGRTLNPPQEAFTPLSPDLHPDLTTRERVQLQTSDESCQVCHRKINSLGFALEEFDAIGRLRQQERGKPIDAGGEYLSRDGQTVRFEGAVELARHLADSQDVRRAVVNRAFLHFVKQPPAAYGADTMERLREAFERQDNSLRQLLVEIAAVGAMDRPITTPIANHDKETAP